MIVLSIKTVGELAELELQSPAGAVRRETPADRTLSEKILSKIDQLLSGQDKTVLDIGGIYVFTGPGSFTGVRIGVTVANTMAQGLDIPVLGIEGDENWQERHKIAVPQSGFNTPAVCEYGGEPNITKQKK